MTDVSIDNFASAAPRPRRDIGLKARYAAESRFRVYGILAIGVGLAFLAIMLITIVGKGYTAFWQTTVTLPITFDEKVIDPSGTRDSDPNVLIKANYPKLAENALVTKLGIDPDDKAARAKLKGFLSDGARTQLRNIVAADPAVIGTTRNVDILAAANLDSAFKGQIDLTVEEAFELSETRLITDEYNELLPGMRSYIVAGPGGIERSPAPKPDGNDPA